MWSPSGSWCLEGSHTLRFLISQTYFFGLGCLPKWTHALVCTLLTDVVFLTCRIWQPEPACLDFSAAWFFSPISVTPDLKCSKINDFIGWVVPRFVSVAICRSFWLRQPSPMENTHPLFSGVPLLWDQPSRLERVCNTNSVLAFPAFHTQETEPLWQRLGA